MAELTVDLTYGSALYQAAKDMDKVDLIKGEAGEILDLLEKEPDLLAFLNTPAIAALEKKQVITKILQGQICDELLNFLCILIDKGRTRHYAKIVKAYNDLINKAEGVSYGKILSVAPLTENQRKRFEDETGKLMRLSVNLENEIDPDLVGGVKIYIDGKVIDASLKKRLRDLRGTIGQ